MPESESGAAPQPDARQRLQELMNEIDQIDLSQLTLGDLQRIENPLIQQRLRELLTSSVTITPHHTSHLSHLSHYSTS